MDKIENLFSGLEAKLEYYSQMLTEHPKEVMLISKLRADLQKELSEVVICYSGVENLTEDERNLLEICNELLQPVLLPKGPLGFISGMAGIMQEVVRTLKRALHKDSDKDKVLQLLDKNGCLLVPSYGSLLTRSMNTLKQLLVLDINEIIANLATGTVYLNKFKEQVSATSFCKPSMAALLAECSEYAYTGYVLNKEVVSLKKEELPTELQQADYDEHTGQLKLMNGFKVWVGRKGTEIIVAFAGTEPSKVGSLLTDFQQLLAPNLMYLYAAGLVRLFLLHYSKEDVYVTGHSLGGGLTQFAVTANIENASGRLTGVGFNSAGLSMVSLGHLGEKKIEVALSSIVHYTTVSDPVSAIGALIGIHVVLPVSEESGTGHALSCLRACMIVYVEQASLNRMVRKGVEENEATLLPVEARALDAPNYMGLPEAKHIYVVGKYDRNRNWGCFGRGYSPNDGAQLVCDTTIYQEWVLKFAPYTNTSSYQSGVANTVNGTCHTLANRILALSEDDNACVAKSIDDAYSVVVFGKYGSGTIQLINLLSESFRQACQAKAMPESLLMKVKNRVMNPYDDELNAWCYVIEKRFNVNVEQLFKSFPTARITARAWLKDYCEERDRLYADVFDYTRGVGPTDREKRIFMNGLVGLAMKHVDLMLNALTLNQLISETQRRQLIQTIKDYIGGILK